MARDSQACASSGPIASGCRTSRCRSMPPSPPGSRPVRDHGRPGISLVTQSGAYGMAVHALGCDESIPFAKVYAAGNKADIADHEILAYLADDPATGVICLLLESISQPREFFEQARRATRRKAGDRDVHRTQHRRSPGRVVAHRVHRHRRRPAGRDAAAGGGGADPHRSADARRRKGARRSAAARRAHGSGSSPIPVAPGWSWPTCWSTRDSPCRTGVPPLRERLRELLPEYASAGNPVDMTPVWQRFPELYAALIDLLARSGEVDVVIPILLQRAATETVAAAVRDVVASAARRRRPGSGLCLLGGAAGRAAGRRPAAAGRRAMPGLARTHGAGRRSRSPVRASRSADRRPR